MSVEVFLRQLIHTIGMALTRNPDLLPEVAAGQISTFVILAVPILAGGSLLLGQSVVLFVNRVPPVRFVFSLLFSGVLFALQLALWAATTWVCARVLFGTELRPGMLVRIASLGSAPLVFGFLIAIPYLGMPLEWALRIWSLFSILQLIQGAFGFALWQAIACGLLGWLLVGVAMRLLGRPLGALRDMLWHAIAGTSFERDPRELVAEAAAQLHAELVTREQARKRVEQNPSH